MTKKRKFGQRRPSGASFIALILVISFFVVLPLSLLGFEFSRFLLMQQQLHAVTDSAALAGTAALASSPQGFTYAQLQTLAMNVAAQTFEQNSILQTNFSTTNVVTHLNTGQSQAAPPPHTAVLNISLLDQNGNPQPIGSTTATTMQVQGIYSDSPIFAGNLLTIAKTETAWAVSNGGLPQLDLALCFDISGSMDDQTPVTLVNRYWDPTNQYASYTKVATGTIFALCGPPNTGTGLNATQPQNLSFAAYGAPSNQNTFVFSEGSYSPAYPGVNPQIGLRANPTFPAGSLCPEQGRPPGNYQKSNPGLLSGNGIDPAHYANGFTDMVVQVNGWSIESCVEASRGNLEDPVNLKNGQGQHNINPAVNVAPAAGNYQKYWSAVAQAATPISLARTAASNFFSTMNISTNGHFMLETFTDTAGVSAGGLYTGTNDNIDPNYAAGGTGQFGLPLIALDSTQSNYQQVLNAIQGSAGPPVTGPLNAEGNTDIADSLKEAIKELIDPTKVRPSAKKAIVLFTDGVPNQPGGTIAAGDSAALAQATSANTNNIPIYTIGLSQNPQIKPLEDALLGDGQGGSGNGIAKISGNNAIYVSVTTPTQLDQAFQTIARSLVVLQ
jgi:Flp pilus assembly protein TadG